MTREGQRQRQQEARDLRASGLSCREIATRVGMSYAWVSKVTKGVAVERRSAGYYTRYKPDMRERQGPILCVCGSPTPHEPMKRGPGGGRPPVTERVDGIPWGFCSMLCYDTACDDIARAILRGRERLTPRE